MTESPAKRWPEALFRLGVVAVLFLVAVGFVRWLIPASLKNGGEHWQATMAREAARPVRFAGANACVECHDDTQAERAKGYHRDLSCETCHGVSRAKRPRRRVVAGGVVHR